MTTSLSDEHREMWSKSATVSLGAGIATSMDAVREALMEAGRRIRRWARRRADRRQLMGYPDYMLRDIGISRCEIDSVLRHGRQGRPLSAGGDVIGQTFPKWRYISRSRRAA
jgi:uncharacterized protein YjiS (DUF1127 family)